MSEIAFPNRFGICISSGLSALPDALKLVRGAGFSMVEVPHMTVEAFLPGLPGLIDCAGKEGLEIFSVSNIAAPNVAAGVAERGGRLMNEFVENTGKTICSIGLSGIKRCSLNILAENAIVHPEQRAGKVRLLKRLAPAMLEGGIKVSLPVRIPQAEKHPLTDFLPFIADTMNPMVDLRINVYPHEMPATADPVALLRKLCLKLSALSLVYEPDAGNYLVLKSVVSWYNTLTQMAPWAPLLYHPRTTSLGTLSRELERLSSLSEAMLDSSGQQ